MGKTTAFLSDWLSLIFNGTAIGTLADNALTAPLAYLYVSLHTADPGEDGAQDTFEASYVGYARIAVARTAAGWTVSGGVAKPASAIQFPASASPGQPIACFGIGTSPTGPGKLLYSGLLTQSVPIVVGVAPRLASTASIGKSSASAPALVMPAGIPVPDFGLTQTVESVYGSADYYTHWVDPSSAAATDSSNPNGSPAKPRLTLPSASNLAAGTVIQIRGSVPITGSRWLVNAPGDNSARPVFIRGPQSGIVFDNRQIWSNVANYLIFENIRQINMAAIGIEFRPVANGQAIHHCGVRDCEIAGPGTVRGGSALSCTSAYDTPVTFMVFARNNVHHNGDYRAASQSGNDCHGLGIGANIHDIWWLWNKSHHNGGDGWGNAHNTLQTTYNLFCGGNELYSNGENAVDIKEVHDVVVSENIGYDYIERGDSHAELFVQHYGQNAYATYSARDVWVINNRFSGGFYGLITTASIPDHPSYWIGNVLYDLSVAGLNPSRSGGGPFVMKHNTIYNAGIGVYADGTVQGWTSAGNILAKVATGHIVNSGSTPVEAITLANDCLYQPSVGALAINWLGTNYSNLDAWKSASGKGSGSMFADPRFVDEAGYNFRLQADSPCIGQGENMDAIEAALKAKFGSSVSLMRDIAGTARPAGARWDIGAYQR